MNSLQVSQKLFSEVLNLKSIEESPVTESFNALLRKNSRLPAMTGMDIYLNNSHGARQQALRFIFPVVEKVLGEDCFRQLAKNFVTASPSLDADLNNFGSAFPDFLSEEMSRHSVFHEFPYIADLARLETFYHAAYYAPDDEALPNLATVSLTSGSDQSLVLVRSHALFILTTDFPVFDIWKSHQDGDMMKEVAALIEQEYLLITRQQDHPMIEQINMGKSAILKTLDIPRTVENLVEMALEKAVDIEHLLPAMIEKGWIRIRMT